MFFGINMTHAMKLEDIAEKFDITREEADLFAIESHMDKVATTLDLDPIELRIINAYRDGDMKAHRRTAKNTALIECCQVVAEKSDWRISEQAKQATSLIGTEEKSLAPLKTSIDQNGLVPGGKTGSYGRSQRLD